MKRIQITLTAIVLFFFTIFATAAGTVAAPQPSSAISAAVSIDAGNWWNTISIKLTNTSNSEVNLQNSLITFNTPASVNAAYGSFPSGVVSYPSSITVNSTASQGGYANTVALQFPQQSWAKTKLPAGQSIVIKFGLSSQGTPYKASDIKNIKVYLSGNTPVSKHGLLTLKAPASPGSSVASQQAVVNVTGPNAYQKTVKLNWSQQQQLNKLSYGTYHINVQNAGAYPAQPAQQTVSLTQAQPSASVTWQYGQPQASSSLAVTMPQAPASGLETQKIMVQDQTASIQQPQTVNVKWGQKTTINNLAVGHHYKVWLDSFKVNGNNYTPNYTQQSPLVFTSVASKAESMSVSYDKQPIPANIPVAVNVTGLPDGAQAQLTLTGSNNSVYKKTLGDGKAAFATVSAGQYNFSAPNISADGKTYVALLSNPYNITQSTTIKVPYSVAKPASNIYSPYKDLTMGVQWSKTPVEPEDLNMLSQKSGVKDFNLAFIVANSSGSCSPAWGGYAQLPASGSNAFGKEMIAKLRTNGGSATLSFGGENGTYLSQACTTSTALAQQYESVVEAYQPKHIDFDVEGTQVTNTGAMQRMIAALKIVKQKYPSMIISFTVQVAPKDGLNSNAKAVLSEAAKAGLDYQLVNIMAMDYGSYNAPDPNKMGEYAKQSAQQTFNFLKTIYPNKSDAALWGMIGITPMIGANDVVPEVFTLSDAKNLVSWSKQKGIKFLSSWSIDRDKPCNNTEASPTCSGGTASGPVQTADYDFAKAFDGF